MNEKQMNSINDAEFKDDKTDNKVFKKQWQIIQHYGS